VSPTDPDLVFARVSKVDCLGIGDDVWRSPDAGATWTRVFSSGDDVTGLVVRRSGQVVLGEHLSGVHLSDDGGQSFSAALPDSPEVGCLHERDDGLLYLCGRGLPPETMALGTSTDAVTWTSILTYPDVDDAYPGCAAGTTQHDVCAGDRWCPTACQLGIPDSACEPCVAPPAPDAGPGDDDDDDGPGPGGCCSAGSPRGSSLLALGIASLWFRRRRRRGKVGG
jgi:hypothetical protein